MGFEISYREHKVYAAANPDITWSKPDATTFRGASSNASQGDWYQFFVVDRAWLHGKYIRFRWQGSYSTSFATKAEIWDGEYVRSSMVDFPSGAARISKGNGLLQTLDSNSGSFGAETKDIQADTSGGSEDKCTIAFWSHDAWNGNNGWFQFDWIEINTGAGGSGNLATEHFTDAIQSESAGTFNDYGYIGYGQADPVTFNLGASFEVGQGSKDLPAKFEVPQGIGDLPAGFIVSFRNENLLAKFDLTTLEISIREHDPYAAQSPDWTFSKPTASVLRATSPNAGLGTSYFFFVANRKWLHGKYIRLLWKGTYTHANWGSNLRIYDGAYVRSSDVDFPFNNPIITKGNGLLQTSLSHTGSFAWQTQEAQLNLAGGSENEVTVFVYSNDSWALDSGYIEIDTIEINQKAGGVETLYREAFNGAITMERTASFGDYGRISGGDVIDGVNELGCGFEVGAAPGSEELPGEFLVRQVDSEDLAAEFIVQAIIAEDLPAEFIVRTPVWTPRVDIGWETGDGTEWDAEATTNAVLSYPAFPGTHRYNYNGRIEITAQNGSGYWANVDAQNPQAGKWRIYIKLGHLPAVGNVIDFFRVYDSTGSQIASVRCYNDAGTYKWGYRVITGDGPAYSSFHSTERTGAVIGKWYEFLLSVEMETSDGEANGAYSLRLFDSFLTDITKANVNTHFQSLRSGRPFARYDGATASFIVDYDDYAAWYRHISPDERANLPGEFDVRQASSADLAAGFIVRHPGSEDLGASFDAQAIQSLPASFEGQVSLNLPAGFGIQTVIDLPAEFISRHAASQELLGELVVRHSDSVELAAGFSIRRSSSLNLKMGFRIPWYSVDLAAKIYVRPTTSKASKLEIVDLRRGLTVVDTTRVMTVTPRRKMKVE